MTDPQDIIDAIVANAEADAIAELTNTGQHVVKWGLHYLQRDSDDVFAGKATARRFLSRDAAEKHLQRRTSNSDMRVVHLVPAGTIRGRERRAVLLALRRVVRKHEHEDKGLVSAIRLFEQLIDELK